MTTYLGEPAGGAIVKADSCELLFDIPDCDHKEWLEQVAKDERARVREVLNALREIHFARTVKMGSVSAAMRRKHLGRGWSAKNLRELYWVYRDGGHKPGDHRKMGPVYGPGDWRALLRTYKGKAPKLPPEFIRWVNEQWAQFRGREDNVRALYRHLVGEVWLKGLPVPGYGTVDDWCRSARRARPNPFLIRAGELPDGWSEATLRRCLPKRASTRKQAAHGYLAAHRHQPDQVLTDRGPLMPMQFIFLDDSRPDFRCIWSGPGGRGEIVYPLLVLALDAASGVDLSNVAKPRALKSPEAEDALERKSRHGVTQDMTLMTAVNLLRKYGLPPYKITFVHENAAACIPSWAKHVLQATYGDRIDFMATGIFKQRMSEHGYTESGGAPYDKAPIEAFWRILMTQLARLPGSTGPRYDAMHGELIEMEKYSLGLLTRAGGVAEVIAKLSPSLLSFDQAHEAIESALRLLRFRTRHNLQGFEKVREWRRSPADDYRPWDEFLLLPPAEQDAISMNEDKYAITSRLECPAERFMRLARQVEWTPVDPDFLTWLEGPRFPATVRDGKITIGRSAVTPEPLIFREQDHPLLEPEFEGITFEAALTHNHERVVLTRDGRILGGVMQQGRVCRADLEAVRTEQGRVAAARKAERERFAGYYLADTDEALAQMRAHNEAVLAAAAPQIPEGPRQRKPRELTAKDILLAREGDQNDGD